MASHQEPTSLGPNAWLVEELAQSYRDNPRSVPEDWRELFSDAENAAVTTEPTTSGNGAPGVEPNGAVVDGTAEAPTARAEPATPPPTQATAPPSPPAERATPPDSHAEVAPSPSTTALDAPKAVDEPGQPLRGVAARIVENMEASLGVPTATSFREVPAKLLEINRKVLNNHLRRVRGGKVSFTHLIGYAIVRAISEDVPAMVNTFAQGADGKPRIVRTNSINLGIAVDLAKSDGSRTLIVPVLKDVQDMSFREFLDTYENAIGKVRASKLSIDDLTGANVTITNPGTIGTVQSVPRLMPGQGTIVGLGSISFPTEYQAADPATLADLGISKIMTVSSTYDHRVIQGAESGLFLKRVHQLLLGEAGFYNDIFTSMGVPYEAVQWRPDAVSDVSQIDPMAVKQHGVNTLINQYRVRGHLIANTNPLSDGPKETHPELDPATFGLTIWDLDRRFLTGTTEGIYAAIDGSAKQMKLGDILGVLRDAYCRTIGIEYMHIANPIEKRWIQEQVEVPARRFSRDELHHILERLSTAEAFEKFLAARYVGQKRFGLEGAESAIPIIDAVLNDAADVGIERAVIGMAHRGRLNVLTNIMKKEHRDLFKEFEGAVDETAIQGSGDVKYHLGYEGLHTSRNGNAVAVELAANPSHLEAVDPLVVGMARAYMDLSSVGNYPILPILVHGDAAFAGQGVVAETLNLSQIKGYKVGGTIHLVINNQLGYTTAPHHSRSSEYSTDVAKMVQAPIIHVNADDPEACVRVAQLALAFRQRFNKDVVIDMIGYRRHGHNEGDDPSYTQPVMYQKISERPSARTIFTQALIDRGELSIEEAEKAIEYFQQLLQIALDDTRESAPPKGIMAKPAPPPVGVLPHVDTSVSRETLDAVYSALSTWPENFEVHPKLLKQFAARDKMWAAGEADWALGEAFAIGSLLHEGTSIRLAGQDSRRGTFAHRHATLHHFQTGEEYTPLAAVAAPGTKFWVYDSTLSEYAGLGFEYGYSLANPEVLTMWEAQFGDFVNGAQIIIDQFIVAAEDKWDERSPLVMLLPHGYEGQGPEHSSARLERFLLLCAEDNIQVANPTTAAQFFHLLRRQIVREVNKPLIVFTPKSGLRAKWSRSPIDALATPGSTFQEVIEPIPHPDPTSVKRVVLASGKVAAEAEEYRETHGLPAAVVRTEQLYPWPFEDVADALRRYSNAREVVWLQEEPENMGAWNSVKGRLYEAHGDSHRIRRVSRTESGSPATGSRAIHIQEQQELLHRAFGDL